MTHKPRADAIWLDNPRRPYVPTVYGQAQGNTKWISTWDEFTNAGGIAVYSEDQTEITLTLPEGFKFSCRWRPIYS